MRTSPPVTCPRGVRALGRGPRAWPRATITAVLVLGVLAASSGAGASLASPLAQTAPSLGTAATFAVLAGSTVTNTGSTSISRDLGVSPGTAVTGFPPGAVTGGAIHAADALAAQAQSDVGTAYNNLAAQGPPTLDLTGQDLGGMTLTAGIYRYSTSAQLTGPLTLNAQGNASAVFLHLPDREHAHDGQQLDRQPDQRRFAVQRVLAGG